MPLERLPARGTGPLWGFERAAAPARLRSRPVHFKSMRSDSVPASRRSASRLRTRRKRLSVLITAAIASHSATTAAIAELKFRGYSGLPRVEIASHMGSQGHRFRRQRG
jgi:hypothetical protein